MLELFNLSKTYAGGVRALDGVTLEIGPGLFGLLGPNGAGKSTLMRTIATLQRPDSGRVLFRGQDVLADPEAQRRRLGYLPQEFGVYPGVSAREMLDHLAMLKGVVPTRARREQVDALLARTHLYAHRKQAVSTFSGGMRRRFGIAQALLGAPEILLVDEPTAGLDPEERHRFYDLLSEVGEQVVIILSTHIVEDVRRLCPRMAILGGGRIRRIGEPGPLVQALRGRVWRRTVERESVEAYRGTHAVLSTHLLAGRVQVRILADAAPEPEFDAVEPNLEDVYFTVMNGLGGVS